jgi:hypothetical protein
MSTVTRITISALIKTGLHFIYQSQLGLLLHRAKESNLTWRCKGKRFNFEFWRSTPAKRLEE